MGGRPKASARNEQVAPHRLWSGVTSISLSPALTLSRARDKLCWAPLSDTGCSTWCRGGMSLELASPCAWSTVLVCVHSHSGSHSGCSYVQGSGELDMGLCVTRGRNIQRSHFGETLSLWVQPGYVETYLQHAREGWHNAAATLILNQTQSLV